MHTKIELIEVEKIVPYDANVKRHDEAQVAKIAQSITRFGFDQPIVVDKNFVIIKGHGRRLASLELGLKKVPVLVRDDLSEEQVKAARLADNRVALSDIDTELLRLELSSIDLDELKGIFDQKELDFLSADLGTMNMDAFIEDIDAAVGEQQDEIEAITATATSRKISISKALGFSEIDIANQITLNRFLAIIEDKTRLSGEAAFVAHIKSVVEAEDVADKQDESATKPKRKKSESHVECSVGN